MVLSLLELLVSKQIASSHDLSLALLAALGVSPGDMVHSLSLHVKANDVVHLDVHRYITPEQVGELEAVLTTQRFELRPVDGAAQGV